MPRSLRSLLPIPLLVWGLAGLLDAQDSARTTARAPARLFEDGAPIAIRLEADFRTVFRDRDTTRIVWQPARLAWVAPDDSGAMNVEIATRGHYRLRPTTCSFPPLRVRFPVEERRGTIWRGQGTLKLATHCRSGNRRYEQITHQEFLVYRMYNAVTDSSFRVRFAAATYVDTRDPAKLVEAPAFFIEDVDDLAGRMGTTRFEGQGVTFNDAEPPLLALMTVFLYMVGGTDWSLPFQHNVRVLVSEDRRYLTVPYDFDWTGFVNAPYARPDPLLNIRTVQERTWRGPCLLPEHFGAALERLEAVRDPLRALIEGQPGLDPRHARDALRYLEEFYKEAADMRRRRPRLENTCGFRP